MDSKNDKEKINIPLFPSPKPTVSCIDDLDFFKDFENEFLAIVYNDSLTSKSDLSTEPTLCPQHIDKFDLKDETSLSEYAVEEQNNLMVIVQEWYGGQGTFSLLSLGKLVSKNGYGVLDMDLPPRDQRYQYLRYEGLQYTDADIADFEARGPLVHELILKFFSAFRFGEAVLDLDTAKAL
nr:hypothetical protein [Tanacetum cinerariifolium]